MSIYVTSQVWKNAPVDGSALLVLLALADFADDEGVCWPAIGTIAHKARISERSAQRSIRKMADEGLIEIDDNAGPKGANRYRVKPVSDWPENGEITPENGRGPAAGGGDKLAPPDTVSGVTNATGGVTPVTPGGDTGVTRTVIEPSQNPPEESPQPPDKRGADASLDQNGSAEEREKLKGRERHQVEADFHRAFIDWPGYGTASKDRAVERWLGLSDDQRDAAKAGIPGYLAACRKEDRKPYAMAGYLKNPDFWRHVPPPSVLAVAKPYGKGWGAAVLRRLFGPHAERISQPTRFIQSLIDRGGEEGRKARLQHLAAHGWPEVNRMLDEAAQRRGCAVSDDDVALGAGFKPVEVGTPLWVAWDEEFRRRGWPWFDGLHLSQNFPARYVYLPDCAVAGGGDDAEADGATVRQAVCEALAAFETALASQNPHNSEAAE